MTNTLPCSRFRRPLAAVIVMAAIVVGCVSCGRAEGRVTASNYCAILPDSVGLYTGNPVTQMGFKIGEVAHITPSPTSVQVDFSIDAKRPIPQNVRVVVRSTSILADRALELVGNYASGPTLHPGVCVPLTSATTPKSLSEVIGAANTFVNGVTPRDSTNISAVVNDLDAALHGNGAKLNTLLTTSSRLLNNPDATIGDLGSVVSNLAVLTHDLVEMRDPLKQILNDAVITTPDVKDVVDGAAVFMRELITNILIITSDLEVHAGDEIQLTLNTVSDMLRNFVTPHLLGYLSFNGGILKSMPWWINWIVNHLNKHQFAMNFRPPLYRVRAPNGALVCNVMNAATPNSCANVGGQPYSVDLDLLQYVFMKANH